jgi:hypothetical protein
MIQLAKHWSHRWEVEFDDLQARIVLPGGVARMTADDVAATALFLAAHSPPALTGSCVDMFG